MVVICLIIVVVTVSVLGKYWYEMCQRFGRWENKMVGDLPVVKYENFVSFYNVNPSGWELMNARVVKKDAEAEENYYKDLVKKYANAGCSYYRYTSNLEEDDWFKLSFRFTFVDYWKYRMFHHKEDRKARRKEKLEKCRKDMEELNKLVNSVKYDISKM